MKKNIKFLIIGLVIIVIVLFVYYVFSEVIPYDDTKNLYISCNKYHNSFEVISSDKISFASNDEICKLDIDIRNVDRSFIKLKTSSYFYEKDDNGDIVKNSISNDIYIMPNEKLILYSKDNETKFEFEYK